MTTATTPSTRAPLAGPVRVAEHALSSVAR
ncbi:hypothetical protein JOF36_003931 [Pseudonocardia parietis]|uniref:Uncharacterized protein n=1 Tax=Pseudonocardia parietis TaxID=570936 RepID=A0ABS4VWE4_9PSEU|nr:hypothetical protein [Pseudonocardia parietis]